MIFKRRFGNTCPYGDDMWSLMLPRKRLNYLCKKLTYISITQYLVHYQTVTSIQLMKKPWCYTHWVASMGPLLFGLHESAFCHYLSI